MSELTITLLGPAKAGKTALLRQYLDKTFVTEHFPTVDDLYTSTITVQNKSYTLQIYDTSGADGADVSQQIAKSQVVLLVYDVTSKDSFDRVLEYRNKVTNDARILLVGTKAAQPKRQVTAAQAKALAKRLGAFSTEADATNNDQAAAVFSSAVAAVAFPETLKAAGGPGCCTIL